MRGTGRAAPTRLDPMKTFLALALGLAMTALSAHAASPASQGPRLTPERVFASPSISGPAARGVKVSPDGRWVSWLKPQEKDQFRLDLWAAPTAGGDPRRVISADVVEPPGEALDPAEKARRERQRLAALHGVVDYDWAETGDKVLIPAADGLFLADIATGEATKLTGAGAIDGRLSRRGAYVGFVREGTLFVQSLATGEKTQISPKAEGGVSFGVAEFVAQEEMGRYDGYWFSPDETWIAYARVDESQVQIAHRLEVGTDGVRIVDQRYPYAGTPNAIVELFVKPLTGGAPVKVDLGADADIYLARVAWSRDGGTLYVERQNRAQTRIDLLAVDPATGASRILLTETGEPWVAIDDDFHPLEDGGFLWGSARTGVHQLYLYDGEGRLIRAVTSGEVPHAGGGGGAGVHAPGLAGVDEAKGLVYFMASGDTPIERQLYVASYRDPGPPRALTSGHGWWTAVMPKAANVFVGYYSDPQTPPQSGLYDVNGRRLRWIEENALGPNHPFAPYAARYAAPEYGILKAADGEDLHYMIQKPVGFDPKRKYPVVVEVYGGPGVQVVTRAWQNPRDKLFLEDGFILFSLDNRGSSNRSMAFQGAIHGRMGSVEVDDQLVGLDWLRAQPFVDPDRIGVSGWSYGGFMTLRMMTDPRTRLRAGAAGAPPTDWRLYDTHYTEQYMGDPTANKAGYDASEVVPRLKDLQGRLLLMQGLADDNVQVENSIAVMARLQELSTPFDLMLYPGQRHGIQGEARQLHLWRTMQAFFDRELKGGA